MVPVERPAEAATRWSLVDATSGAGGLPVESSQADAYYFAPQKSFASDGGLWLALLSPAAQERIAELDARSAGSPPFCRWRRRWRTRSKTRPTTRRRWRPSSCSPTRFAGCSTAAAWTGACSAPPSPRRTCTAGRRAAASPRRSSPIPPSARWSSAPSTSPTTSMPRGRRHAARQRDRRRRALPQAGAQPAAHRHVPRRRAGRRAGAHGVHRLGRREDRGMSARANGDARRRGEGARQGEDRRLGRRRCCASTSTSTSVSSGPTASWPSASAPTTAS